MLEDLEVYNPFSGVTTNKSESFNSTMKRLQSWREVPVDAIILALYHLQAFYHNEVQCGLCGVGSYILCDEFTPALRSLDEIETIPAYPLEDIVSRVHEKSTNVALDSSHADEHQPPTGNTDTASRDDPSTCSSKVPPY